ncbi:MAG TPA: LysM peptidoglycan-binding domain-containing protein [Firmicutes bacterium]|nr:LysM peptidoglycan-binding domain-containing protein [Bacillota bacterium]
MRKKYLIILCVFLLTLLLVTVTSANWTYTVKRGDTLYRVARRVGVSLSQLRSWNGLWTDHLRVGQRLTIPSQSTGAAGRGGSRAGVDRYLLARLVHAEAEAEPYSGKVAVAAVILNRVENPKFPNTLAGVVYQPLAFESVANGRIYTNPNSDSIKAAGDAINGWDPTGGALFFWNPSKPVSRWIWSRRIITRIGKHVFGL